MTRTASALKLSLLALVAVLAGAPASHAGIIVTVGDEGVCSVADRVSRYLDKASAGDDGEGDDGEGEDGCDARRGDEGALDGDAAAGGESVRPHGASHRSHAHGASTHPRAGGLLCHDAETGVALACPPSATDDVTTRPPADWGCHQLEPGVFWCELPGMRSVSGAGDETVAALGCSSGLTSGPGWALLLLALSRGVWLRGAMRRRRA